MKPYSDVRAMTIVRLDSAARAHSQVTQELITEWVQKIAGLLGMDGPEHTETDQRPGSRPRG